MYKAMSTYRAFEAALHHHRKRFSGKMLAVAAVIVVVIAGGVIYWVSRNHTSIQEVHNQPIVTTVEATPGMNQTITEPFFTIELPGKWKEIYRTNDKGKQTVEWQSTEAHRDARFLTAYVDNVPQDFGFNRLLPLTVLGDKVQPGPLSDNCITFTNKDDPISTSGYKKATWQNVRFLCDAARTERNLLGTGTVADGLGAKVSGTTSQTHTYFFTYADNTSQVNLETFTTIMASFKAK